MIILRTAALLVVLGLAAPVRAQGPRGRLLVTVADTTAAVIPDAKVTVVGLDEAAKAAPIPPVQTSPEGVATFTGLAPGRYSIVAEFSGFEMGLVDGILNDRPAASDSGRCADTTVDGELADRIHADAGVGARHTTGPNPLSHGDVRQHQQLDEPKELQWIQRRQLSRHRDTEALSEKKGFGFFGFGLQASTRVGSTARCDQHT